MYVIFFVVTLIEEHVAYISITHIICDMPRHMVSMVVFQGWCWCWSALIMAYNPTVSDLYSSSLISLARN